MSNAEIVVEALKHVCFCLGLSVGLIFAALVALVCRK